MVNKGPSQGCGTCRRRKVRCDQARPICDNCVRLNLQCAGYPKPAQRQIRFHNETEAVVAKQQRRKLADELAMVRFLSQSVDDRSVCFFINNYATGTQNHENARGFFECLPPLYSKSFSTSALWLATSLSATTLDGMWRGKPADSELAIKKLGPALRRVQQALDDPVESLQDETLMAVLLLNFYDMLAATSTIHKAASQHQNGALALVKHRGQRNFRTELSKSLLLVVRNAVVTDAVRNRRECPLDEELWGNETALPFSMKYPLHALGAEVAQLQAAQAAKGRSRQEMVSRARVLDAKLVAWVKQQPPGSRPTVAREVPQAIVRAGVYDPTYCEIYPSFHISMTWNSCRWYRLVVAKILLLNLDHSEEHVSSSQLQKEQVQAVVQSVIDGVCASVPFHVGNRTGFGTIYEFSDPSKTVFPYPPEHVVDYPKHVRTATACGGWHILGSLAQVRQLLNEDDLLASLIRDGQKGWIEDQFHRLLTLHNVGGRNVIRRSPAKRSEPVEFLAGTTSDH